MDRSSDAPVDGPSGRPVPLVAEAREWVGWFGVGRLVVAAAATVVVALGAWWLVRTPPPPTEAVLPGVGPVTSPPGVPGEAASGGTTPGGAPSASARPLTEGSLPDASGAVDLVVHVVGAVESPGVYEIPAGSRVADAIEVAGGPVADADVDALNLAAPVVDGARLQVPRRGEAVQPIEIPVTTGPDAPVAAAIDLNRAGVDELDTLPGVGPATAAAIVAEREAAGPFATVDDLTRVPGIGPAKLAALRDLVTT